MNKERIQVNLTESHRGNGSTMFTGRPQGLQVRQVLELDTKDKSSDLYEIIVPKNTTSFNASFFLGLFYPSIKKLKGYDNFSEKYLITVLEDNELIRKGLLEDLSDCERQARNEYAKITGLSIF
jgi:hypothetical protein